MSPGIAIELQDQLPTCCSFSSLHAFQGRFCRFEGLRSLRCCILVRAHCWCDLCRVHEISWELTP